MASTRPKVHVPGDVLNGTLLEDGEKVPGAGAAYDAARSEAGGIDVQILGIGTDGHMGFNEPGSLALRHARSRRSPSGPASTTRASTTTCEPGAHARITQGIGTILKARHLVLLAFGARA